MASDRHDGAERIRAPEPQRASKLSEQVAGDAQRHADSPIAPGPLQQLIQLQHGVGNAGVADMLRHRPHATGRDVVQAMAMGANGARPLDARRLDQLYQDVIREHAANPKNHGSLKGATTKMAKGYNPLCGDQVDAFVKVAKQKISQIKVSGDGCALTTASASIMSEVVKGRSIDEVKELAARFKDMVTGHGDRHQHAGLPGELGAFNGVYRFPTRHRCALLAWEALLEALGDEAPVTTAADQSKAE